MEQGTHLRHEDLLKKVKLITIIVGALYILIGIGMIAAPELLQTIMGLVLGIALAAIGAQRLYVYFKVKRETSLLATDLYVGIILVILGVVFIAKRKGVMDFAHVVYGILIVFGCIIKLQNALDLKHVHYFRWWIVLILTAVSTVMAALLIIRPQFIAESSVFMLAAALFMIYDGVSGIAAAVLSELVGRKIKAGVPVDHQVKKPASGPAPAGAPGGMPGQNFGGNGNPGAYPPPQGGNPGSGAAAPGGTPVQANFDPETGEPINRG